MTQQLEKSVMFNDIFDFLNTEKLHYNPFLYELLEKGEFLKIIFFFCLGF